MPSDLLTLFLMRNTVFHIFVSLDIIGPFSMAALKIFSFLLFKVEPQLIYNVSGEQKIFSLSLVVSILITMYLSVVFLMFLELEFFEILGSVGSLFLSFLKHLQPLLLQIFCSLPFFVESNFTSIRQLEVILQFNDSIYIFSSFFPSVSVSFCSAVSKLILMLPS